MELINKKNFKDLKDVVQNKIYKKVLVIGGNKSFYKSKASTLISRLTRDKEVSFFLKKKSIPMLSELIILINKIKKYKPNLIIAIGGGTVMDLSKISNAMHDIENIKYKIENNKYKIKKNFCDIIAIPMTAGSGAEVTANAVIYIDKKKYSIEGELIKPNHMALFPELVINNKRKDIICSSAFDCFAQAVESMFSTKSNKQSIEFSKKAIIIFNDNYKTYIKNKSYEKGYLLSLASYYSGKAISISKTIAPHAVSYPFTSYFNVNHGHAVSLTFDSFLQFSFENLSNQTAKYNLKDRYHLLFRVLKINTLEKLLLKIKDIKKDLSLETKLSKINKKIPSNLDLIINNVNTQRLANSPVNIEKQDIYNIIKKIV